MNEWIAWKIELYNSCFAHFSTKPEMSEVGVQNGQSGPNSFLKFLIEQVTRKDQRLVFLESWSQQLRIDTKMLPQLGNFLFASSNL